jgi:membrane-bound lytic murein transglycosylase B
MHTYLGALIIALLQMQSAIAQEDEFLGCIGQLQSRARLEKIPSRLVDEVLPKLRYQPRVIELDRSQPEFTQTFADYLNRRVTPGRIRYGRALLAKYDQFLSDLSRSYGVAGHYLIAFWGLETNFGHYLGNVPTLDALATLACDPRRSAFFTDELMQALRLLERESLTPEQLRGSWAGAMGHTQFMPSAYIDHAVDGDRDGQINLWRSELDALASGANFLQNLGWQTKHPWGREITLPVDFPYGESGLKNPKPQRYWLRLGVRSADGGELADTDLEASVLLPAGHTGPAFLVYPNFNVILSWNRSEFYALSVGLLADRLRGAPPLRRPPSEQEVALRRSTIEDLQRQLNRLSFDAGPVDGVMGSLTQAALREFQAANGIIADGYPGQKTLCALSVNSEPASCL